MLNKKYDFENNNQEEIEEPSIVRITNSQVSISHASGTDITNIPEDGELIIQIGNIESYNPTSTPAEPEPEITPQPSGGGSEQGGESGGGSQGGQEEGGDTPVNPTPSGSGIILSITNNLNINAKFSGKVILNIAHNQNDWANSTQVYANMHSEINEWHQNDEIIEPGQTNSYTVQIESFLPGSPNHATATDGTWYILGVQNPNNSSMPVYLYSAHEYGDSAPSDTDHARNVPHSSASMYIAGIPDNTLIQDGNTYNLSIIRTITEVNGNTMTLYPDTTGYYVIL